MVPGFTGTISIQIDMVRTFVKNSILIFLIASMTGCLEDSKQSDNTSEDGSSDRKEMLTFWAESLILPGYQEFDSHMETLILRANNFAASPNSQNLGSLREAWKNAYLTWQKVEMYEVGPAEKYTMRSFFNIYPTDVAGIESNISNPTANLELPGAYARQGFPALDYLINGVGENDQAIIAYFQEPSLGSKRLAYLTKLTVRMDGMLSNVFSEWKGPYKEEFINKTGLDIGSSTAAMVNAYVLYYERHVRSGKIGIPSGATIAASGVPNPEKIEAFYSEEISRELAQTAQRSFEDFFNGVAGSKTGPSLKSYLNSLAAKDPSTGKLLSDYINEQFAVIDTKLNQLSPSLYNQILTNNQPMVSLYNEMQKLVRILKVDMTSAMSITITYTDNDGD